MGRMNEANLFIRRFINMDTCDQKGSSDYSLSSVRLSDRALSKVIYNVNELFNFNFNKCVNI